MNTDLTDADGRWWPIFSSAKADAVSRRPNARKHMVMPAATSCCTGCAWAPAPKELSALGEPSTGLSVALAEAGTFEAMHDRAAQQGRGSPPIGPCPPIPTAAIIDAQSTPQYPRNGGMTGF